MHLKASPCYSRLLQQLIMMRWSLHSQLQAISMQFVVPWRAQASQQGL